MEKGETMRNTCPFKFNQTPDYGKGESLSCLSSCNLWVESEKMCSFRLLADDVADHRRRIRACGMKTGEESFQEKKEEKIKIGDKVKLPWLTKKEGEFSKTGIVGRIIQIDAHCEIGIDDENGYLWTWKGKISEVEKIS